MLAEFRRVAASVTYQRPMIAVVSNLTGALADPDELCAAEYWVRHVREAVRFADGVAAAVADGVEVFVEVGPDAVLTAMAREVSERTLAVPLQRRDHGEALTFLTGLAGRRTPGASTSTGRRCAARRGVVELPTYAFQRQRYWLEDAAGAGDAHALGLAATAHPLLGATPSASQTGRGMCSPVPCHSAPSRGWPTMRSPARSWCPVRRWSTWRCGRRPGRLPRVDELTLRGPVLPERRSGAGVRTFRPPMGRGRRRHRPEPRP